MNSNNTNKKNLLKMIAKLSVVISLYIVLVFAFNFMSFEVMQFRIAEVLMLLVFFNKKYSIALMIGCFIANLLGPYGLIDAIFGTLATGCGCLFLIFIKNIYIASWGVPISNIIVGIEIAYLNNLPPVGFITSTLWIMLSEAIVVCFAGVLLFKIIMKNKQLNNLICDI